MKPAPAQGARNPSRQRRVGSRPYYPIPYPETISVRTKFGETMDGMEVHENGIVFRSPMPYPGGKILEVTLCRGSILVDAEVIGCEAIPGDPGMYRVRVRYLPASPELVEFIADELEREHP